MATLTDIATTALEHLFVLVGGETPSADDAALSLAAVQRVIARLPEYGGGRVLVDETWSESATATKADARIITTVSGVSVPTPADPADGTRLAVVPLTGTASVSPTERKIEGATASVSVSAATSWVYRADLADWVRITSLTGSDSVPYSEDCEGALGYLAAREAAPSFEVSLSAELGRAIVESESFLRAKFSRPREQDWRASVPWSVTGPGRLRGFR